MGKARVGSFNNKYSFRCLSTGEKLCNISTAKHRAYYYSKKRKFLEEIAL